MDAERRIADLEAQIAAKDARIAEQDTRIAELEKKLATLIEERSCNSSNSNLPPSSDSPAARAEKNARKQVAKGPKRKRGGQQGHRDTRRELLPAERVDDVVDFFPEHCEHCAADEERLLPACAEVPPTELVRALSQNEPRTAGALPTSPCAPRALGPRAARPGGASRCTPR